MYLQPVLLGVFKLRLFIFSRAVPFIIFWNYFLLGVFALCLFYFLVHTVFICILQFNLKKNSMF